MDTQNLTEHHQLFGTIDNAFIDVIKRANEDEFKGGAYVTDITVDDFNIFVKDFDSVMSRYLWHRFLKPKYFGLDIMKRGSKALHEQVKVDNGKVCVYMENALEALRFAELHVILGAMVEAGGPDDFVKRLENALNTFEMRESRKRTAILSMMFGANLLTFSFLLITYIAYPMHASKWIMTLRSSLLGCLAIESALVFSYYGKGFAKYLHAFYTFLWIFLMFAVGTAAFH